MGMAGVMSGVMHAPLTGVFLIAELTGGYDLFLPLMIVSVSELVKAIAASHRNIFPVTDKNGILLGIVLLDDIRNIMFRQELYHRFTVNKLMTSAPAKLFDTDGMEQVMQTFDDTKAWNLPVVNEEGKYLGFVSKSKIFNSYRQVLVHFSED